MFCPCFRQFVFTSFIIFWDYMIWSCVGEQQGPTEEADHPGQLVASHSDPIGHTPSPFPSVRRRPVFSEMLHSLGMKCSMSWTLERLAYLQSGGRHHGNEREQTKNDFPGEKQAQHQICHGFLQHYKHNESICVVTQPIICIQLRNDSNS